MVFGFIKKGFAKVQQALSKTRSYLSSKLKAFFSGKIDLNRLEELEQILYEADLGAPLARELTENVRRRMQHNSSLTSEELVTGLKEDLYRMFPEKEGETNLSATPTVFLIVGVNGNGKTTTTAKLAYHYQQQGHKAILGAADTFRAAATEQLEIWANRLNVDLVKGLPKSDPSAIAFDTLKAAEARGYPIALIDTAGRLHTKTDLMQELEKIRRVCNKAIPGSPHEIYLVLDATTGQNAVDQAQTFMKYTPLTGLILTKLDGTAKGGIVLSIQKTLGVPVKFIGVGEGMEDLEPFDSKSFIDGLFGE
jgi:fused signal recognition particle receptor